MRFSCDSKNWGRRGIFDSDYSLCGAGKSGTNCSFLYHLIRAIYCIVVLTPYRGGL